MKKISYEAQSKCRRLGDFVEETPEEKRDEEE